MMSADDAEQGPQIPAWVTNFKRHFQIRLDATILYPQARWVSFCVFLVLYVWRVYLLQGFYIVSYGLGIYLLNLCLGFLSPAVDPDEVDDGGGPMLPTRTDDEEFRPFVRKLPEFKFWQQGISSVLISITMTFFAMFDLPVFWPILLGYFILLVGFTMKERIRHMIQHKYIPFNVGKQTYGQMSKISADGSAGAPARKVAK